MSVMIGSVTERLAPDSDFMKFDNTSNSSVVDLHSQEEARVRVAAAVTCLSGLFQVGGPVVSCSWEMSRWINAFRVSVSVQGFLPPFSAVCGICRSFSVYFNLVFWWPTCLSLWSEGTQQGPPFMSSCPSLNTPLASTQRDTMGLCLWYM